MRGLSAREIMARLKVSMWQLPAIVSDMRKRKLAAASETPLFAGIPAMLTDLQRLGIKTAIVSSDSEASVRQVLGPTASLITRFDCGAAVFGKHWKFRHVARKLGAKPSETICIGDEIRDIEAANATGMDSGAVAWGYALPARCRRRGRRISSIRSKRSRSGSPWRDSAAARMPAGLLRQMPVMPAKASVRGNRGPSCYE